MTNKYREYREKKQKVVNEFPLFAAFTKESFKKGMEKFGYAEDETDKIIDIGASCFIKKDDKDRFEKMFDDFNQELQDLIDADKTGEGFITDMFEYELGNYEYVLTYDLRDTLDALGYTMSDINQDEKLLHGLETAIKNVKEWNKLHG